MPKILTKFLMHVKLIQHQQFFFLEYNKLKKNIFKNKFIFRMEKLLIELLDLMK